MTQENSTQTESSQFIFGSGSFLNQNQGTTYFYCTNNDFSGRPVDEVVRIQHQQFLLQQQYQTQAPSSLQPPSGTSSSTTATVAPHAPSRSVSAPLFTGSFIPPPSTPSGSQAQAAVLPTPQKTAGKGKRTQKKKQSPVEESKEIANPKRKEVESAIGPSSEKPRSRRLRIESDEYNDGNTQIP